MSDMSTREDTTREWTTVDKADWGEGPWATEPDKVQWIDEATGLDCLIHRGPQGALCGYVGLPPEHPCHGVVEDRVKVETDDGPDYPDVHGGLTYANLCVEGRPEGEGVCHVPESGRPANVWWLGFDCAHSWDFLPGMAARMRARGCDDGALWDQGPMETYRDIAYVKREVGKLAAQLVTATAAPERD
jgi:hypothetical protein